MVELSKHYAGFGTTIAHTFKHNSLNIYEVSTGKHQLIKKSSLIGVLFDAHFLDNE